MQQLSKNSISQLNSDLIITSLWDITREALENSLDAKASSIELNFFKNGIDGLIISDNGKGISSEGLSLLGEQGVTSKMDYEVKKSKEGVRQVHLKYQGSLGFRVD
jgi:DNA mismatch repair ATPase MutL